jgi:hypothetical protein
VTLGRLASLAAFVFALVIGAVLALLGQKLVSVVEAAVQLEAHPCPLGWELLVLIGLIVCAFGIPCS